MESRDQEPDYSIKLVIIGDSGVGKSNLLKRFMRNDFSQSWKPTIGVELATRVVPMDGKTVKVQVWDTAGQERYRAVTSVYYRGAVGAAIVYDVTQHSTFRNVETWLREIRSYTDQRLVVILVGNKKDLKTQRGVSPDEAYSFAVNHGLLFAETSALSSDQVEETFLRLIKEVCSTITPSSAELMMGSVEGGDKPRAIRLSPVEATAGTPDRRERSKAPGGRKICSCVT